MQEQKQAGVVVQPAPQPLIFSKRRRVGLYGGTFNPVHNAHLLVADQAGKALCLDQVLFLPDAQPPHVDHKEAIDVKDRVAMLRLAIANNSFFGLELDEVKRGGTSYSYDTVKRMKERHPDVDYYFIIGGDMVDYLHTWYRIDDLVKLVHFVGVRRPGAKNETSYPVTWVDVPQIDFSSTDIRQRVKTGQSIKYMVPSAVEDYIEEHQLYHD